MGLSRRAFVACAGTGAAGLGAGVARGESRRLPLMLTYVAGSDRYAAPALADRLEKGSALRLRREPDNVYDDRAVSVWTADGKQKLGYVPRIHNQAIASLMDGGVTHEAQVGGIGGSPSRPDIAVAVTVVLPA